MSELTTTFEIVFLAAAGIYFLQSFLFLSGAFKKFRKLDDRRLPKATVIVAARNEEKNILRCLESLNSLEYPSDSLEIIIADDASTDATAEIIQVYIKDKPRFRYLLINERIGHLKGKTNALANAIRCAEGEVILTTDADCAVPPLWAKTLCSYYQKDVDLVCGYTSQSGDGGFYGMQSLDFIYLLTVAAGTINLGVPLSCIGNNMSYRRSAYLKTGGYEALPFSVTEDFNMLHSISSQRKANVIYPLDENALVVSEPCQDLKTLYWQKKRWGVGGLDSDWRGFAVMTSGFIANACILLSPLFFSAVSLYLLLFKIGTDFFFLYQVLDKLKQKSLLKHFFAFEIYFIIYVLALPVSVLLSRRVIWKDRKY